MGLRLGEWAFGSGPICRRSRRLHQRVLRRALGHVAASGYACGVKPSPVIVAAAGGFALLVTGLAVAGKPKPPPAPPAAPAPELPEPAEDGFVHLEKGVWTADRLRWCSFIEIGGAPERNGATLLAQYQYSVGAGAVAKTWKFFDDKMTLTMTSAGSMCFANAKAGLPVGEYRFPLQLETATVAIDPAQDAALAADPAWLACFATYPERIASPFLVPVVVDTDGRVWASDGTRETENLRDCLGTAATAWAKTQVDNKTFPLQAPAVVYGKVLANAVQNPGTRSSLKPRTPAPTTPPL